MKLLKMTDVMALTTLSRAKIYELIGEGLFPRQVSLVGSRVAWVETEVHEWIEDKIAQRDVEAAELEAA